MKYELPIKGVGEDEDIFDSYFADMDLWCDFQIEVQGLAKKYGLSWNWMRETLRDFVIYNKVIEPTSGAVAGISLVDLQHLLKKDKFWLKKQAEDFPIAICIHPYASQRDVLDFVKKNFKDVIDKGLEKHRNPEVTIGKKRKKNQRVKERNEFICKNSDLDAGKLWSMIKNEFGDDLDFGTIYKIKKGCGK